MFTRLLAQELPIPDVQTAPTALFPFIVGVTTVPISDSSSILSSTASASAAPSSSTSSFETFHFSSPLPDGVAKTASGKPIPCSPKNTKLNPSTHKLISECTAQAFCLAPPGSPPNATGLGVCVPRLCRRDMYPFGYGHFGGSNNPPKIIVKGKLVNNDTITLPPMCPEGLFCPDDGSGCRPRVTMGEKCELGRDEQCQTPVFDEQVPLESNRALCLNKKCIAATQNILQPCTIENTTYVSDISKGPGGGQFSSFVVRHNCLAPHLFCDPTALHPNGSGPTCQRTRRLGAQCTFDAQCDSLNCEDDVCTVPPDTPNTIAAWHWIATFLFILVVLTSTIITLAYVHRQQRYSNYHAVQEYYREQMGLRQSIMALHKAASRNS
ncbi:hypothetical protein CPB83DRAFT_782639, partial [Crepidotus variabilis]